MADQIRLQFIILIWGFTGIIGAALTIPALEVVLFRTAIATLTLAFLSQWRGPKLRVDPSDMLRLIGIGLIVGLHWILFFAAVKSGGVSVGLVGLSTSTLWSALLAPFFTKQKISTIEVMLGIVVIIGLATIAAADYSRIDALILSVSAAFFAGIFSHCNGIVTRRFHHRTIAFYEMLGAFIFCAISVPIFVRWISPEEVFDFDITWRDFVLLLILSWICTVYAYSACVELLQRISVFATNLAVNLEPVYGILLAAVLFGEHETLTLRFYLGAATIVASMMIYPFLTKR